MSSNVRGQRFVLGLYAALVTVAGVAGFLTGTFVSGLSPPRFLFLIPFPATPLGFAAYGALTIALVLGVPLVLVVFVSARIDDDAARGQ
ncbi:MULTISPECIES: cox cluster protein [Haloferax]|uniref:Cox cluster protein n=2 Tax=Haloferax TaxID=2251 RepID=A0A6G1Z5C3_9EURY|nr:MULTISPECIES: cox cluster protein [Haloferax]KAB1189022.1 cox cluster protein [Haloferax sp. CBA1149]MRW81750.1 cox cluster protein [Haloferax marinisediminis]